MFTVRFHKQSMTFRGTFLNIEEIQKYFPQMVFFRLEKRHFQRAKKNVACSERHPFVNSGFQSIQLFTSNQSIEAKCAAAIRPRSLSLSLYLCVNSAIRESKRRKWEKRQNSDPFSMNPLNEDATSFLFITFFLCGISLVGEYYVTLHISNDLYNSIRDVTITHEYAIILERNVTKSAACHLDTTLTWFD